MRLLKLAALALFGYALYEFFRGMVQDTRLGDMARDAFEKGRQGQQGGGSIRDERGRFLPREAGINISGPGRGTEESTLDRDGGSVSHKVGRGVVS
jgi:hypothetical protein